jgi:multidrug efflux pump subunit AcrB
MDRDDLPGEDYRHLLYWGFALSLLLVYLALAARYESWIPPLAVISAVPLALPAADP